MINSQQFSFSSLQKIAFNFPPSTPRFGHTQTQAFAGRPTRTIPSSSSVSVPASLVPLAFNLDDDTDEEARDELEFFEPSGDSGAASVVGGVTEGDPLCSDASLWGAGFSSNGFASEAWTLGGVEVGAEAGYISFKATSISSRTRVARLPTSAMVSELVGMGGRTVPGCF